MTNLLLAFKNRQVLALVVASVIVLITALLEHDYVTAGVVILGLIVAPMIPSGLRPNNEALEKQIFDALKEAAKEILKDVLHIFTLQIKNKKILLGQLMMFLTN